MSASAVLSVRVTQAEKSLLQAAAEQACSAMSEFMRRKALEAAEHEIMSRRVVTLENEQWEAFESRLNQPAQTIPAVQELFSRQPAWQA